MEGTPLYSILRTLEQPTPIQDLNIATNSISVIIHTSDTPEEITIENIAPFHTIEDLSRAIWAQTDNSELFPKYSFLCTIEDDTFIPSMITWVQDDQLQIKLPNPESSISSGYQQDFFVEADGSVKLNTRFLPRGRVTLEDAYLLNGTNELPQFHIFSLEYLRSLYTGATPISEKDWNGLFYPYFYQVKREGPFSMTQEDDEFSKQIKIYISAKQTTIKNLNELLQNVNDLHQLNTTNVKQLNFTWPDTISGFEGADVLFYSYPVNEQRPYMRLLTPNTTPLTKLYRPNEFGLPYVNDLTLLKAWVQDRAPDPTKNCLYVKILLRKEDVGISPLYGTLMLFDDGDAHLKIQPPKDIRSLDFRTDLSNLDEILTDVSQDMPYNLQAIKLSKANLTVDLDFRDAPPKNIRAQVQTRLRYIESIFQPISPPEGQPKPLFMLRYKAVSNFIKEDSFSERLTYYITRKGFNDEDIESYKQDLAKEFEISEDIALEKITEYFEKKQEMTLADSKTPIQLVSSGTDISIVSKDVNTFSLHIYNLKSEQDLVRIISIISGVFLSDEETWDSIFSTEAPTEKVKESETLVEANSIKEEQVPASSIRFASELINVGDDEEDEEQENKPLPQEAKVAPTEKIVVEKWFIKRLQQLDNRLFGYPKEKGVSHYSSQCANNEDRYPAIFTEAQYIRMRKIYEEAEANNKVGFILYGDPKTKEYEEAAKGKREKISVLRYGSDANRPNYYLCSEYYCLRDMLPVLVEDWESDVDKPAKSCLFCHGKLIINQKDPQVGETVLRRKIKPRSRLEKRHLHIGFLGEGKNPYGYDMPCCFVSEQKLGWADPKFDRLRAVIQSHTVKTLNTKAIDESERKESVEKALLSRVQQLISFDLLKYRIHKEYVLGSEKHPLEPGKIGLPNIALDNYFLQDSSLFVARSAIKQEFKPSARGMFRLGVFNRITSLNDSLFAALAPALGKNSVQEVKKYFTDLITPRVFINLNFGNLLLEFFKPSDDQPTPEELASWAQIHLQINKSGTEFEISRFYRSYHRFIDYINDPTKKKLLRHFIHALAEPNLLVANGLTIVTLEYIGDPREPTSTLNVKCPSLGYNIDRYERNNVCFLTYHESGIWEPLIFINKILKKDTTPLQQEGIYSITHADLVAPDFPNGIKDRYLEFVTECRSSFRGAYSYQQGIDVRALIPVTRALQLLTEVAPVALVRDSYNHLIAITVRGKKGSRSEEVLVPVVDDGNSFHYNTDLRIHIGLQSVELAPASIVEYLYTNFIFPYLGEISDIYEIENFLSNGAEIFGYRIGNDDVNINLPCSGSDEALETEIETIEDFQFEYELNRAIIIDSRDSSYQKSPYLEQKEIIEDVYQHLRLTFSTWVATNSENSKIRSSVKKLLERNDIPDFEKIRRLEIELESTILTWLSPDANPFTPDPVFLRSDCTSIKDPSKCTNYCSYSDGQCKIHTPEIVQISTDKRVEATKYLTARLFDEIVRLPARAYELLYKGVKRIQVPSTNIQIGEQWIIPQGVPAWYDLLRTTDLSHDELPQYYEEFSRSSETSEETKAKLIAVNIRPIPDEIKAILPKEHVDKMGLHVIGPIALYFGISDVLNKVFNDQTLAKISNKYKKPVIQILSDETPIRIVGRSVGASSLKSSCIVIVPDLQAVLVTLDTMSDSIPGKYIKGPVYDSIQQIKARLVKVPTPSTATVTTVTATEAPKKVVRRFTLPPRTTNP